MFALPPGWEKACLVAALDGAGLRYQRHETARALATLSYGPDRESAMVLAANVSAGALRIGIRSLLVAPEPTVAQLGSANDATIDWAWGSFGYHAGTQAFTACARLFAYPDHVPPAELVRGLCHGLWLMRSELAALRPIRAEPPGTPMPDVQGAVLARFAAAGLPLAPKPDGSFLATADPGDDGRVGLRVSFERAGIVDIDALPLAVPPWSPSRAASLRTAELNDRLMLGAVTWWGGQLIIRQPIPMAWLPDHPRWAHTVVDAAIHAARDVVKLARAPRPGPGEGEGAG